MTIKKFLSPLREPLEKFNLLQLIVLFMLPSFIAIMTVSYTKNLYIDVSVFVGAYIVSALLYCAIKNIQKEKD